METPALARVSASMRTMPSGMSTPPGQYFATVARSPSMMTVSPLMTPTARRADSGRRAMPRPASRFSAPLTSRVTASWSALILERRQAVHFRVPPRGRVGARILSLERPEPSSVAPLSTGLRELDRQIRGPDGEDGIPSGSIVAVESPPGAQVEPLVWSFMTERPSVYVSTLRSGDAVRDELGEVVPDADYTVRDVGFDTPVRDCSDIVELVDTEANVVVDPVTPLEDRGGDRYVKFLNDLQRHLTNVGGVALLLAPSVGEGQRVRQQTLGIADMVWRLHTEADHNSVESYLIVRKFRGGGLPDDPVSVDLGRRVSVDTSRDIA